MATNGVRDISTTKWEDIEALLPNGASGFSAKEVFASAARGNIAYTYDDIILMPGKSVFPLCDI